MTRWLKKHWTFWALGAALGLVVLPQSGFAGGFELPDNGAKAMGRGGAYTVGANDLTALHYNPARLFTQSGSNLMWNHNLVWHDLTFSRATLSEGWGIEDNSFESVSDAENFFAAGGFVAASSDFGLEDWVFAMGVYGPSSVGKKEYPDYGPQAFMLTDMDLLLAYYSASMSYQPANDFSVGLTVQWVDLMKMDYSVVVDASKVTQPSPLPSPASQHTVATLQLEDRMNFTAILGVWAALSKNLEVGAAARVIPVDLEPQGKVSVDQAGLNPEGLTASAPLTLPIQARGGLRYIHRDDAGGEQFDIELDVFYENWSVIEDFYVDLDGRINGETTADVVLPRNWTDTISVRLGSDINTVEDLLTLRVGGYWENGATPANYEHLDFPSFDRYAATLGSTLHFGSVNVTLAYAHIIQEDREVTEEYGKVIQQRPLAQCPDGCDGLTGVVGNAGTFTSSFQILSLGVEARFSDWF